VPCCAVRCVQPGCQQLGRGFRSLVWGLIVCDPIVPYPGLHSRSCRRLGSWLWCSVRKTAAAARASAALPLTNN
jgi:hypothetical protein